VTEVLVFAVVVGNYGFGLKRDGLPYVSLCGAATGVYWAVRLVCGFAFLAVARHAGREPVFFGESAMMAAAPVAALCAYAVVRVLEARALKALEARETEARAKEAATAPAAPPPLLPPVQGSAHPRLTLREERVLAIGLVAAGLIMFGHTLATARPFWREDLNADDRALLRRRADEIARLETRLLDCNVPPQPRDREAHRRALDDLSRRGLLRLAGHRTDPAEIQRRLDAVRAERCGSRRPPAPSSSVQ
jgi:hypothetical protein